MLARFTHRKFHPPSLRRNVYTVDEATVAGAIAVEEETYSHSLQTCARTSNLYLGQATHAQLIKYSLLSSRFLRNHLLNMYCKCGALASAMQVLDEMPERNVVSWSALVAGFVQHNRPGDALSIFGGMRSEGVPPNEFALVSALNACSLSHDASPAYQIYALVVRFGFEANVFLGNAFLTALIRHGKLMEAEEFFRKCKEKDTVSWNAMIAGYLQFSYSRLWGFWCRMNHEDIRRDNFTFATVLTGLAALSSMRNGLQVHAQLVKHGHGDDICAGNALVDMYLKNRCLIDGSKAFDEMPQKDVVSWTQMASGYLLCGEPLEALQVIRLMRAKGVMPNKFTLATALNASANLSSLEEGKKAHGFRVKLGSSMDSCVDNALLDMYAKCGCVDGAFEVFRSMSERSVITWTTMIVGFAQNGHPRDALKIFDEMRLGGVEPNYITFIGVLYACSQGGFIDEGWGYFSSMEHGHGILPGEDHYACMVDLLSRAGRIAEAEALILSMPFQPGVLLWQTLLGACRIHGDLETGKRAAHRALALDKQDSSTYVLLSNMYADANNWKDVGRLRKLMGSREVRKMPGCSWTAAEGVHSVSPQLNGEGSATIH